jgi:cardiolipin synthase
VLLDDFGRRSSFPSVLGKLRRAGLEVRVFMPLRGLLPGISINLRNHRKLLVVDGRVAFAGGMNIGDRQLVTGGSQRRAQDLHFMVLGPVVAQLSALFATDWHRSGGAAWLPMRMAPPPGTPPGRSACRIVADGPDEQIDQLALTIEGVISCAQSRVVIVTPYFLLEHRLAGALQSAALRGVAVTVLIPARCNWPFVRWALNHQVYELLNTGVRVMERPGLFAHSKCMIVDDSYALIGSHNLDARSLRLNFEMGMEIFDAEFVDQAMAHIEAHALSHAVPVTVEQIASRRVPVRIRDALAALFAPYL